MKRLTRAERSERNRERVLDAAGELFRDKGFHGASLEQIADEAGFSKGVIYSQFGSKDDLFLALLERRMEGRVGKALQRVRDAPQGVRLREIGGEIMQLTRATRRADVPWLLAVLEFRVHAARDPELNLRYAALHRRTLDGVANVFELLASKADLSPQHQPTDLARFIVAVDNGEALEELVEGEETGPDLSGRAVRLLVTEFEPADADREDEPA